MTTPIEGPESGDPEVKAGEIAAPAGAATRPGPLGASTFTIEGRAAPALFVIAWLGSLLGLAFLLVGVQASDRTASLGLIVIGLILLSIGLVAAAGSQGLERRARGAPDYAGPSPLLVFAASIPISVLAVIIAVGLPLGLAGIAVDGPIAALLSVAIQAIVYVGLIRLLVVDVGALDWIAMGVRTLDRNSVLEMIRGALWALPVIVATVPVALILVAIFRVEPESPLPATGEVAGFAVSFVAGVLVAPLGEEILFRGFATTAWVRGVGVRQGVLRAALVFAMAHILTTSDSSAGAAFALAVVGFGTRVPIAIALGWLFVRRGTIWASFGLHAAFNAVLLVIAEAAAGSPIG